MQTAYKTNAAKTEMEHLCFSRVPTDAVIEEADGSKYAMISHRFDGIRLKETDTPRKVRADGPETHTNGNTTLVWFATLNNEVAKQVYVPFGVTVISRVRPS